MLSEIHPLSHRGKFSGIDLLTFEGVCSQYSTRIVKIENLTIDRKGQTHGQTVSDTMLISKIVIFVATSVDWYSILAIILLIL